MTMRKPVWFMVASHSTARLMKGELTEIGRCHVEEQGVVTHEDMDKEYHRPSPRSGRSGNTQQDNHIPEESVARFARKVATQLEKMMAQKGIQDVKLFAPPRMMGALKKAVPVRFAGRVEHCKADLAHLDGGALAKYPAVMDMVQTAAPLRMV